MITSSQRAQATRIAAEQIASSADERQRRLNAIASALGSQDPQAVIAHLNPRVLETRMADILVEAVIEAMEDHLANA